MRFSRSGSQTFRRMSDSRAEPSSVRPPAAGSLPVRPLALWALFIPVAYAPALLIGSGFDLRMGAGVGLASVLLSDPRIRRAGSLQAPA